MCVFFFVFAVFLTDCQGGGFTYVLFSPLLGEDSHFDEYFSRGLVQPPTSCFLLVKNLFKDKNAPGGNFRDEFLEPRIAYVHEQGRPGVPAKTWDFSSSEIAGKVSKRILKLNVDMPHITSELEIAGGVSH